MTLNFHDEFDAVTDKDGQPMSARNHAPLPRRGRNKSAQGNALVAETIVAH